MDVTTYITPPGFHLLDAAGTLLDGLAESFSSLADAQNISGSRRAAALLFSVAERALMTAKCTDDFLDAEHAAAESYLLFNVSGDFLSAAFSARLFVHALRAQAFALPCGRVGLEGGCREHFLDVATEFVDEEIARAELHGNDIPKMVLSLSRAEIMCDKKQSLAGALQAGEDIFSNVPSKLHCQLLLMPHICAMSSGRETTLPAKRRGHRAGFDQCLPRLCTFEATRDPLGEVAWS